jgi:hypothetical protein
VAECSSIRMCGGNPHSVGDGIMGEFFHGWRRKTGWVLLLMSTMFTAAWVRSLKIRDVYSWKFTDSNVAIRSFDGGFGWQRSTPSENVSITGSITGKEIPLFDPWSGFPNYGGDTATKFRWEWGGFDVGWLSWPVPTLPPETGTFVMLIIPYWTFAIPLALLSAYLLLWKPRMREPQSKPV